MSDPLRKADHIRRAAIAAARRQFTDSSHPPSRDELLQLRVQTTRPIVRILVLIAGLVLGVLTVLAGIQAVSWLLVLLLGFGSLLAIGTAVFGRKKHLDGALSGLDVQLSDATITAIIDALF